MHTSLSFVCLVVAIALIFDFMNGFHDAANSVATIVSTRVLTPLKAVIWAALFNFVSFMFFGLHVANTLGKGIIDPGVVDSVVIFSSLMGAISWNVITWYFGIPSSSSHALIGGLLGAALCKGGLATWQIMGIVKIGLAIVFSPIIGFVLAFLLMTIVAIIFRRATPQRMDRLGRRLQLISASLYSLGHGGNDAQKTMGIIAILLFATGNSGDTFHVPLWVVLACQGAMGLGTLFGGWRIVRTMGMKLAKLRPIGGCCAETAGALLLFFATAFGIPVSTTHTITGSIMGVGAFQKMSSVRWGVVESIVWAWVLTIPCSAAASAAVWILTSFWV